jgi:lipoyl(octanoyl) transferase
LARKNHAWQSLSGESRSPRPRRGDAVNSCSVVDLGRIAWTEAFTLQQRVVAARKAGTVPDTLLFCEHPNTITLGRNARLQHLLASESLLRQKRVELHHTNRGGDITYHGPGQLVGYPILHLAAIRRDIGWYMRMLEEAMIRASAEFGVTAVREAGKTGVWVAKGGAAPEKLAALGVHLSRWVTSHGFAYNVSTDLRYFGLIVPCGIAGSGATSLEKLLGGASVAIAEVAERVAKHLGAMLNLEMRPVPRVQFMRELERAELSAQLGAPAEEILPAAAKVSGTTIPGAGMEAVRSDA